MPTAAQLKALKHKGERVCQLRLRILVIAANLLATNRRSPSTRGGYTSAYLGSLPCTTSHGNYGHYIAVIASKDLHRKMGFHLRAIYRLPSSPQLG